MSYPMDLDEVSDEMLRRELSKRKRCRDDGVCDYCMREPSTPPCKFPERHAASRIPPTAEGT